MYKNKFSSLYKFKIGFLLLLSLCYTPFFVQAVNPQDIPSPSTDDDAPILQMNLWIESQVSGVIQGSSTTAGREGSMEVFGYHHLISTSPDSTNQHSPFRIVKVVDKASPYLMQALCNHELLVSVVLRFYQKDELYGNYVEFYRIELTNAKLIGIETHALVSGELTETISLNYESISWI